MAITNLGAVGISAGGAYNSETVYKKYKVVSANGGSYMYINPTPAAGIPVSSTSHWQQIASQGLKGDQGNQGPKGDPGEVTAAELTLKLAEKVTDPVVQKLGLEVDGITIKDLFEPNDTHDTPQGVNLLKFPFTKSTINSVLFEVNTDGSVSLLGTPPSSLDFLNVDILEVGQTYTLRYEYVSGAVSFTAFDGTTNLGGNTSTSRSVTFTATATNLRARISSGVPQNGVFRMQIEKSGSFTYWNPPIYMPFTFDDESDMIYTHQLYLDAKNNMPRDEFGSLLDKFGSDQVLYDDRITNLGAETIQQAVSILAGGEQEIILPPLIPSVVGMEMNVYFNNVLKGGRAASLHKVRHTPTTDARMYDDHSAWIPTVAGSTVYSFDFFFADTVNFRRHSTTLLSVPTNAGSGLSKKALFIGDSITATVTYLDKLLTLFNADAMNLELIGTRGTAPRLHEGRSAWAAYEYCTTASFNGATNAFWNPNTSTFDFAHYMAQNSFAGVDYVFINLGTNDLAKDGHNTTEQIIGYYNTMIDSIKAYDSNIKIFLWLTPVRARTGDNDKHKNSTLNLINAFMSAFNSRTGEGIYTVPVYVNLDPLWDFPSEEVPISARNPKTMHRITDDIHPNEYGHAKIADVIFSYIKYFTTL